MMCLDAIMLFYVNVSSMLVCVCQLISGLYSPEPMSMTDAKMHGSTISLPNISRTNDDRILESY